MASMVAKACSSASTQMPVITIQEKGSRNKRKFRADPPLTDPNKSVPLPQTDCPNFTISSDQFEALASHDHETSCDMCCLNHDNSPDSLKLNLGLPPRTSMAGPSQPREDIETPSSEFHDADWSDLTESQLEELLLSSLDSIFKSAIKKIAHSGYSEEVASKAILRTSLWYGCNDMVSNIVENTLAFLNSGQDVDGPSREHCFEDLKQMEKYVLAEFICLLREVRPFFSAGDAMWCLLICDMNVSHACALDSDSLGSFFSSDASNGSCDVSSDPNTTSPCVSDGPLVTYARRSEASNTIPFVTKLELKAQQHTNPQASSVFGGLAQENGGQNLENSANRKPFSAQEKLSSSSTSSRKLIGITKRDYILRQKSLHFEKYHHRTHSSKGTSRPGKLSNFGGLVLDKKLKALSDSSSAGLNLKNQPPTTDITNAVSPQPPSLGQECTVEGSLSPSEKSIVSSVVPSLTAADTELSLSLPSKTFAANPTPINFSSTAASKEKSTTWAPHNRQEIIAKPALRAQELQAQIQEWTEWTNQKVMQALRRLSKEKDELKALRLVKEEAERLKKEQQSSEESNLKKLAEIENALRKAGGQVQRANAAVRRREIENVSLRRELEAAVLHAAESAMGCDKLAKREKAMVASLQSSEKQKMAFQDELVVEKRRAVLLQQALEKAKDARDQAEGKLHQEVEANGELLSHVSAVKKEREQIEASAKSKEDSIKLRAETNLQKYKDEISKLEKEISRLRLKKDSSKIAALKRGIDGKPRETRAPANKDSTASQISKMTDLPLGGGGVGRDRECVMCLSEEMSVVFLPCAHQVVCTACNELHEKKGMKDCPSCRTPIGQRLAVRYYR